MNNQLDKTFDEMSKHGSYQHLCYVTVEDLREAMANKPSDSKEGQEGAKTSDKPYLNRLISYFENKYYDLDKNS